MYLRRGIIYHGLIFVLLCYTLPSMAQNIDLLIQNARIVDGTGAPWFLGDVAVTGDKITNIGSINTTGLIVKETVNANGSYVSPGFVDSHTHDDIAIMESPSHEFKVVQGVTTVVTGNCGFSNYPEGDLPNVQQHLSSLLGIVPPEFFYKNFSSLRTNLQKNGIGLNVASLVGHGPLRLATVGYDNREATDEEIQKMSQLLEEQLIQGSIGLSLGLVYPPSSYAGLEELVSLGKVVKKYDRVLSAHVRSYEGGLISSVEEFIQVLRESGAKGLLSHLQVAGIPYWNTSIPRALEILENARLDGIDVNVDMYPYLAGSSTILQLLPPSSQSGGFEEFLNRLKNATYLTNLKNVTEGGRESGWESKIALIGYENVAVGSVVRPDLVRFEGMSLKDAAMEMQMTEFDFLIDIVVKDEGRTNVIMYQQSQQDNFMTFSSRLQMIGSDSIPRSGGGGKPHPRGYGSFPRVIGRYALQDKVISMEDAVKKSTSMTATRFGILDRGLIRPGMKADLVLFTKDIMDKATYEKPRERSSGIQGVWVNGVRVVGEDGELVTGNGFPGNVVSPASGQSF